MYNSVTVRIGGENFNFPVVDGTEGERAIDFRTLRKRSGFVTFDEGYGNTGSCLSKITFIDGEKGILRYRGYPIEELAEKSNFLESAYLIIYGEFLDSEKIGAFTQRVLRDGGLHKNMEQAFLGFASNSHPMAMLSSLVNVLGSYYSEMASNNRSQDLACFDEAAALLVSKVRAIAANSYRIKRGNPINYPKADAGYCENFLHMMFSNPHAEYEVDKSVSDALDLFLLLHADHEQNCSTSTVRMVASGGANLFASVSAGINALWGPLHGGANMAVVEMLEGIRDEGDDGSRFLNEVKDGKRLLMGFGHRVYKNYDPRAKILQKAADSVLRKMGHKDPLLEIARHLEQAALHEEYFLERKLYPNVDFYSGIILNAIGIPLEMFTVMFAIGRMPGWIAHWKELASDPKGRIHRPRQIYSGATLRNYPSQKTVKH